MDLAVERMKNRRIEHRRRRPETVLDFHRRGHYGGRRRPGAVTRSAVRAHSRHPERATAITPLTTGLGAERNVSFSPDGAQIVDEWEQEDHQRHIYVKVVGAGDPIPLTSGAASEYGPEWSPDGRLIAFLRTTERTNLDLYVVPPFGGVERKVTSTAAPEGMNP